MRRTWVFWLFSGVLASLGLLLTYKSKYDLSRSLGHALVIAAILMVTVDRFVKERLLKEVSWDVTKYLVGYNLPGEIQDRIRQLMASKLIRRDCEFRFRVVPETQSGPGRMIRLEVEFSFELENITNADIPYEQQVAFEKWENSTITEIRCDSDDEKAVYCLKRSSLGQESANEPGVFEAHGQRIKVQAHNVERKIRYRVGGRFSKVLPENSSDVIDFASPTINVTIMAQWPEGIEFFSPPTDRASPGRWEYRQLFLPGEHIRVRWMCK
jgi:hypothetical protein